MRSYSFQACISTSQTVPSTSRGSGHQARTSRPRSEASNIFCFDSRHLTLTSITLRFLARLMMFHLCARLRTIYDIYPGLCASQAHKNRAKTQIPKRSHSKSRLTPSWTVYSTRNTSEHLQTLQELVRTLGNTMRPVSELR
jgi:hypothetical protein